ncbi:PREDICTED: uncharacterized protein LOC105566985 [Vollenhovia emeryi]|uniref:uncharacterized protein LOC105566985 n=1 Tax=Vollenhovia emeryi TaxID=411798 RepID=UPI0005F3BE3B|nr:PREDICTED: uncharacterized protein LOC105566985 [Vollenhovia emeryi]XP_011876851.1 PREDICTED: uncharacterized protein LOC105566985 [Vollenhovia emeryi]
MERLRSSNRTVDISEPILAEDSTFSTTALSLSAALEQLDESTKHHDYLVALLLVLLAESGFSVSSASDAPKWERNTRLVQIPVNWKSQETGVYEIYLTLRDINCAGSKLFVIAYGDKLILNVLSHVEEKRVYSMVVQTLKYVNPYTTNLCLRYMNLKEISHRFKDKLVTPLRRDMLVASSSMGPSLESLPIELRAKIVDMLSRQELECLSICSKKLHESYSVLLPRRTVIENC